MDPQKGFGQTIFSNEARVIEDEECVYRILNYTFDINNQHYLLEIGKNVQLLNNDTSKEISRFKTKKTADKFLRFFCFI